MPRILDLRLHLLALLAYAAVAVAFTWPLAAHLGTHLTGVPEGDTGIYVWNQWVFRHELVDRGAFPYETATLFAGSPANLSLHNYTLFQNLVALPLSSFFGVVATFNLVYLLITVATAYCAFLLARELTGSAAASWLGGLAFAWSPVLVARGTVHFSLAAAAPLALFLLLLVRVRAPYRLRDAAAFGVAIWWAASTDVYFAVYCVLLAAIVVAGRVITIRANSSRRLPRLRRGLDALAVAIGVLIVALMLGDGWEFAIGGRTVYVRTLYNPVLALTFVVLLRIALTCSVSVAATAGGASAAARMAVAAGLTASVLMSPVLYAAARRILAGDFDTPSIFWRSSPPGIDLLALLLPNPNHPLLPAAATDWLRQRAFDDAENVAALPWMALLALAGAVWAGWRPPRRWLLLTAGVASLAIGPFLVIAGLNTHIPGPWSLLRYIPVVGLARTPARFSIVLALLVAVLFAMALSWLIRRYPSRRRLLLAGCTVVLMFELLPAPRFLHSASVPSVYARVATAPGDARLLELPYGVRDGTSSVGNFTARTLFFQTAHGKTVLGGYLSRVAARRIAELRGNPVLNALATLSENRSLSADEERRLGELGPALLEENNVKYVVVDGSRASPLLRETAIRALRLGLVERDGVFELYRPAPPGAASGRAPAVNAPRRPPFRGATPAS
jgi:hypothetical protein